MTPIRKTTTKTASKEKIKGKLELTKHLSLPGQDKKYKARSYSAARFLQRGDGGPVLVIFHAPVKEILEWAAIGELGPTSRGPQREQREVRVQAIEKFLIADSRNVIPTAVILAFGKGCAVFNSTKETLNIKAGANHAATIVDGQHRLYGIYKFDPSTEVPIVALLDADEVERAFHFLVINNKSSRVTATHTKALLAEMQNTELVTRLRGAKLAFDVDGIKDVDLVNSDIDSPFYQSVDWTTTPIKSRMVQASAIELSLDYLGGLGVSEFDDRDIRRSVFLAMWKVIKNHWKELWLKDSRLISKVGIFCLTRFIIDRISAWADNDALDIELTDLAEIEAQTTTIIGYMDKLFWSTPWAEKSSGGFDTNQGRERVYSNILQLFRNGRNDSPWYTDIDIIERSAATKRTK